MSDSTDSASPGVTLWILPEQVDFARRILDLAGVKVARAGCPQKGQSVAASLNAEPFDDLRAELAAPQSPITVLFTSQGFADGAAATEDLRALAGLSGGSRTRVLTLEPVPSSANAFYECARFLSADQIPQLLGLPRRAPSIVAGAEWLESLNGIRAASFQVCSRPGEGTLAAVLARAFDLLVTCMGEPESLDASFVHPRAGRALHAAPGDTLAALEGVASGVARFADGRCAAFFAHDRAASTEFRATLVGTIGQLSVDASCCIWHGAGGDSQRWGDPDGGASTERQLAKEIEAAIRSDGHGLSPTSLENTLLMGQAALLSTRTGVPESPETIRKMSRST